MYNAPLNPIYTYKKIPAIRQEFFNISILFQGFLGSVWVLDNRVIELLAEIFAEFRDILGTKTVAVG